MAHQRSVARIRTTAGATAALIAAALVPATAHAAEPAATASGTTLTIQMSGEAELSVDCTKGTMAVYSDENLVAVSGDPVACDALTALTITGDDAANRVNLSGMGLGDFTRRDLQVLVETGAGKDHVVGGPLSETINGGADGDTIDGEGGDDTVNGGDGSDDLAGGTGNDLVDGGGGNDIVDGNAGDDLLIGGPGDDVLRGKTGDDELRGGDGDDNLNGGEGDDKLLGEEGNDSLDGGEDDDSLWGGPGVDELIGGFGDDALDGGGDADVVIVAGTKGWDRVQVGPDRILTATDLDTIGRVETVRVRTRNGTDVVGVEPLDGGDVTWVDANGGTNVNGNDVDVLVVADSVGPLDSKDGIDQRGGALITHKEFEEVTGRSPYAGFRLDEYAVEGARVVLDGRPSFDPDDAIVTWEWDLDWTVDAEFDVDRSGAQNAFVVDGTHTRTIALRVTDASGNTHIATSRLKVLDRIARVAGDDTVGTDRIGTAVAMSRLAFSTATSVVLARAFGSPADALAGTVLAAEVDGPLLLTRTDGLAPAVAKELRRLKVTRVFVLGGTAAISDDVAAEIEADGIIVQRLAGGNRYDTARKIAQRVLALGGPFDSAVIALGRATPGIDEWPDALAAGNLAMALRAPIVPVENVHGKAKIPGNSDDILELLEPGATVYVAGGEAAVPAAIVAELESKYSFTVVRVSGESRYGTALALARHADERSADDLLDVVIVASGASPADALGGVVTARRLGGVLVLVPSAEIAADGRAPEVRTFLDQSPIAQVVVAGGPGAITDAVFDDIRDLLSE